MIAKWFILLMLAAIVMQGCTSLPLSPAAPAVPAFQHYNAVLPDFVYGYPMHY